MKMRKILYLIGMGLMVFSLECNAQQQEQNDSTVNAVKIKNLKSRKAALTKRIAIEDKKRNIVIDGVSPETLEKKNEKQDSLCLELRSEMAAIDLELKELTGDNTTSQIIQQYGNLIHNNQADSIPQTVTGNQGVPAKPAKPTKPAKPAKPVKTANKK